MLEGLIGEVARQKKVRVVNWLNAYRNQCFLFSHSDTYHHTMMSEPVVLWENMEWDENIESHLMDYLASRWHGSRDWISFNRNPEIDLNIIYMNQAAERMLGYSSEEVMGKSMVTFSVSPVPKGNIGKILDYVQSGKVWSGALEC